MGRKRSDPPSVLLRPFALIPSLAFMVSKNLVLPPATLSVQVALTFLPGPARACSTHAPCACRRGYIEQGHHCTISSRFTASGHKELHRCRRVRRFQGVRSRSCSKVCAVKKRGRYIPSSSLSAGIQKPPLRLERKNPTDSRATASAG